MNRRDFFRKALALSVTFAAPCQQTDLYKWIDLTSPATASLSIKEELSLVKTLAKTCWQLLPHCANVVEPWHLYFVRASRQELVLWLSKSPGSSIDLHLLTALSEFMHIEGWLLYAFKRVKEAEQAYRAALGLAREAKNIPLEIIELNWFSNFLIDSHRANEASAPAAVAWRKAEKGGASQLVRAWITATQADAWANLHHRYGTEAVKNSERALDTAALWTPSGETEQERYPVPYDYAWLFGYRGAVYARLDRPHDALRALNELKQGLTLLDPAERFRHWGFYNDLIIAHGHRKDIEEACHYARLAINMAEQAKAPIYLQRLQGVIQRSLNPWNDSPLVTNLLEELQVVQQKLVLA